MDFPDYITTDDLKEKVIQAAVEIVRLRTENEELRAQVERLTPRRARGRDKD